jgi:hypothetical protein
MAPSESARDGNRPRPDWSRRQTLDEIKRRFGPDYGIKDLAQAVEKKRPYQSLTDDELRRLYPRHDETDVA